MLYNSIKLKLNFMKPGDFFMERNCKVCQATLISDKCDYCGTVNQKEGGHAQSAPTFEDFSSQPTFDFESNTTTHQQNSYPSSYSDAYMPNRKLLFNTIVGIFAILCAGGIFIYNVFFWGMVATEISYGSVELLDDQATLLFLFLILGFFFMIAALVLHIIGIVQSKRAGISVVGHVLGIVGVGVNVLTFSIFSFVSIILFILAGIFCLLQKNVTAPVRNWR